MRAVVQRVSRAQVTVADEVVGRIGAGLLVYAAAAPDDGEADLRDVAEKVAHLRIFPDAAGKMNLSVIDADGAVLLVMLSRCRRTPGGVVGLRSTRRLRARWPSR